MSARYAPKYASSVKTALAAVQGMHLRTEWEREAQLSVYERVCAEEDAKRDAEQASRPARRV